MSLLKELADKGATVAWSNVASHPNLIALGTKDSGGVGFDDYGAELELHKLDFADPDAGTLLGKVKTSARFATIAWSEMATRPAEYPYGLIAGGMGDGTVVVWDPAKLVASHPQPQVSVVQRHQGAVNGLQFNPHKSSSHLLASGGSDNEVYVMALDRPEAPNVFVPAPPPNTAKHTAEVTKVAWNTQVSHILATASANGTCIVWDLRQKKPWCELRDAARASCADVAWNPDEGLHLVTASGDDNSPVLKLWDLRSSTTLPLATLQGHSQGILSVGWCPWDSSLLMSCAKDNRTLLWDLFNLQAVYELPSGSGGAGGSEGPMFGGYGSTSQRRYQVAWSPCIPTVVATCSFDRKVQAFSMSGFKSSTGRAPKWLNRPVGASFAFGGKLVSFGKGASADAGPSPRHAGMPQQKGHRLVKISRVEEDPELVAASRRFEAAMASGNFRAFCVDREASARNAHERKVWQFMQVIFEQNAREQLLSHLGFNAETISREATAFVDATGGSLLPLPPPPPSPPRHSILDDQNSFDKPAPEQNGESSDMSSVTAGLDAVDLATPPVSALQGRAAAAAAGVALGGLGAAGAPAKPAKETEAEALIKKSLLVGNFEAAVQVCLRTGALADALLLASCGGADLWAKTKAAYFERETPRRPFLGIVSAIIKQELAPLVHASDLRHWQETLAIVSTYAQNVEFPALCEVLGNRLETEAGDAASANLCYMCAVHVGKTVEGWVEQLRQAANGPRGSNTRALHEFVEKVSVFSQAEPKLPLSPEVSRLFAEYAEVLAAEGEVETAAKYCSGDVLAGAVLRDRLFHSVPHTPGTTAPPAPFATKIIGVSPNMAGVVANGGLVAGGGGGGSMASPVAASGSVRQQQQPAAVTAAAAAAAEAPLPPGWTKMIEPTQGIPYYCNTATGQTQWERPAAPRAAAAAAPLGSAVVQQQPHQQQQQQQQQPTFGQAQQAFQHQQQQAMHPQQPAAATMSRPGMMPATSPAAMQAPSRQAAPATAPHGHSVGMAPRPGGMMAPQAAAAAAAAAAQAPAAPLSTPGGFGAPHAHAGGVAAAGPGSAGQAGGFRAGMGAAAAAPLAAAPVAAEAAAPAAAAPKPPADPAAVAAAAASASADAAEMVQTLNAMLAQLTTSILTPADKKMLGEINKAVAVLFDKMGKGVLEPDVLAKAGQFVLLLRDRDIHGATTVHTDLVNTSWNTHKDWLKGIKHLTSLVAKKL